MNIFELTYTQLTEVLARRYGKSAYHAAAIYRRLYRDLDLNVAGAPELAASRNFAVRLAADITAPVGRVIAAEDQDGVVKFVTRLADGLKIESVVLPMARHKTVCVSCQAGCRMGCRFCETGKNGLDRNLETAEIVGQVFAARKRFGTDVRNVVFMGMGEPFDNYDRVLQAIAVISDQRGLDIAPRRITVSTAGIAAGIRKFADANPLPARLAISLNAPNDELRSRLMPVNRKLPLGPLRDLLLGFPLKKKEVFMVSYVLIPGVNDRPEHAVQLADYLDSLPSKVNLIAFNPGSASPYRAPSEEEIEQFRDRLIARGVNIQRRSTKGCDLMAACGQLGSAAVDFTKQESLS